jgi:hypothetical protein
MAKKKIQSEIERKEIKAWLKRKNKDFDEGFELFVRYSHNRALAMQLARLRRLSKLEYELEKIAARPFIKESRVWPIAPVVKAGNRHQEHTEVKDQVTETGKRLVVMDEKINYDELPEDLKKLYDENRESYKIMRAVHEKMKLATKDQERADYRAQLVTFDDKIAANWEKLDEWASDKEAYESKRLAEIQGMENASTGSATEILGDNPDPNSIAKDLNACRSFISRNVKKVAALEGAKKEKLIVKLAERVATLQKHKAEISEATRAELINLGLLDENNGEQ